MTFSNRTNVLVHESMFKKMDALLVVTYDYFVFYLHGCCYGTCCMLLEVGAEPASFTLGMVNTPPPFATVAESASET
jgi:hypothetical protein